jgi:TatA/E family protein of Tat protein translocase
VFGHLPELGLILIVALIVFGPEKLPEVAHNVGKLVRDVRQALDTAINPEDHEVPDDFSTYYYESLARSGEAPPTEAPLSPEDSEGNHLGIPEEDLPTSELPGHRADWS